MGEELVGGVLRFAEVSWAVLIRNEHAQASAVNS
jgi:hypothetical protein